MAPQGKRSKKTLSEQTIESSPSVSLLRQLNFIGENQLVLTIKTQLISLDVEVLLNDVIGGLTNVITRLIHCVDNTTLITALGTSPLLINNCYDVINVSHDYSSSLLTKITRRCL